MNALIDDIEWTPDISRCASKTPEIIRVGRSLIHLHTGRVESPEGERFLRRKELKLLVLLYEHVTQTFSREQLLQLVWNYQPGIETRTVDQTVATLRKKIEFDSDSARFVQTVYGLGYRLAL